MFKKQNKDTSTKWPVTVSIPQHGGTFQKAKFYMDFKPISIEAARQVFSDDGVMTSDDEFFQSVITGFYDVQDEDGQAIQFNSTTLKELMDIPYVLAAVGKAYRDFISGQRAKN